MSKEGRKEGDLGIELRTSHLLGNGKQLHTTAVASQVSLSMHIDRLKRLRNYRKQGWLCNHHEGGWWRFCMIQYVGQKKKEKLEFRSSQLERSLSLQNVQRGLPLEECQEVL